MLRLDERLRRQRRIAKRAKEFDIGALIQQLDDLGIAREDIVFRSNSEPVSRGGIIEAVDFFEMPSRHARVTLNMGLTGPNALVPSYFQEIAEKSRDADIMFDFLHFFDHALLDAFIDALYPERPTGALKSLASLRNASFSMLGVGSISTLQWLFGITFPELRVAVQRDRVPMLTDAYALHAGTAMLDGAGVLGVVHEPHSAGLKVSLYAEEEDNDAGKKWIDLVERRFERIVLPVVRPYALTLKLELVLSLHRSWARLEEDEGKPLAPGERPGYLGYDRIEGSASAHRVVVFEGAVNEQRS